MTRLLLEVLAQDEDVRLLGPNCSRNMARIIRLQIPIENFGRVDAKGNVVCRVSQATSVTNIATYPWWQQGMQTRRFTMQGPITNPLDGKLVMIAMLPLFDAQGTSMGSINARIGLDWIKESLTRTKLAKDAVAAIVDESGKTIVSTGSADLFSGNLNSASGTPATMRSRNGTDWLYASAPLFENRLRVVYARPKSSLFDTSREELRLALILPILAILFTTLAVWVGVNRLAVRWLHDLATLARQITIGNYHAAGPNFQGATLEIESLGTDMLGMAAAISDRNDKLEAAAATAQLLAREVNHRVKNNLQMVISLLSLQVGQLLDPTSRQVLEQTRIRVSTFALVYRLLYDGQGEAEKGQVDKDQLITELCAQLRASNYAAPHVNLEVTSGVGLGQVDNAIPLALFLVEAVSNAYLHGFPDGRAGTIGVHFERQGKAIRLSIIDDGIGYDPAVVSEGMGHQLMQAFAGQLGGTLAIDKLPAGGMSVILSYTPRR
ncbi:MAG: histidine kinase dimerization/phosphoacceptor domain -containing protein [Novosphingobium sp.]